MDRAEKARKYRKSKSSYNRRMRRRGSAYQTRIFGFGIIAVLLTAVLFLIIHNKSRDDGADYVTEKEFASLMSFLGDAASGQWDEASDSLITQGKMKEYIQSLGLSEIISVTGKSRTLSRKAVMGYYDQILDYLDLDGSVKKKTILCLSQSGSSCLTQKEKLKLNDGSKKPEPFYVYDVYAVDKTILGICGKSSRAVELKDVAAGSVSKGRLSFQYQNKDYKAPYEKINEITENVRCMLSIQDGRIIGMTVLEKEKTLQAAGSAKVQKLPASVRVLLLNRVSGNIHYDSVYLKCNGDSVVKKNKEQISFKKSDGISTNKIKIKKGKYITAVPRKSGSRLFLTDEKGTVISNGYYGSMEIYRDKEGYYIVNEVPVEKYLYSVVASEMPSSFAPEALKAQAVCARSYVYRQMAAGDYNAWHAQIDDSTNYQVYNRSEASEACIRAVTETAGQVMYARGEIINAYYFSASCGYTSGMEIWNQSGQYPYLKAKALSTTQKPFDLSKEDAFQSYITAKDKKAFDSGSPYYRWKARAELSGCLEQLKETIQARKEINPQNITLYSTVGKSAKKVSTLRGFGGVTDMYCAKRSKSGAVLKLVICFEFGRAEIKSEYNMRAVLGCALEKITYADGSENASASFLPSAWFSISFDQVSRRYLLTGGGNGHGMGMSQYGADGMAKKGWDYKKILAFFYNGVAIK